MALPCGKPVFYRFAHASTRPDMDRKLLDLLVCPTTRQPLALLEARGYRYAEINLAKDPEGRAELVALTGQMTFPQIVVGKRSIGGFRELLEADRAGMLDELLAA